MWLIAVAVTFAVCEYYNRRIINAHLKYISRRPQYAGRKRTPQGTSTDPVSQRLPSKVG